MRIEKDEQKSLHCQEDNQGPKIQGDSVAIFSIKCIFRFLNAVFNK